jgi:hypothetical protein
MTLSENGSDYLEDSVYKYKLVETPAWYELKGDKISRIILPKDVGFSGRAYGVITSTVRVTDGKGGAADGFVTLTAGRTITWAGNSGLAGGDVPTKDQYNKGQLFEFQLRNGEVTNVASVDKTVGELKSTNAVELSSANTTTFAAITSKTGSVVTVTDANGAETIVEIKDKAIVYVVDASGNYSVGSLSSVREKALVRLYDVSDDKVTAADAVIIRE